MIERACFLNEDCCCEIEPGRTVIGRHEVERALASPKASPSCILLRLEADNHEPLDAVAPGLSTDFRRCSFGYKRSLCVVLLHSRQMFRLLPSQAFEPM